MRVWLLMLVVVLLAGTGCDKQAAVGDSPGASFSFDLKFQRKNKCQGPFPEVTLAGVPEGTDTLQFHMIDLDWRNYDHGRSSVKYSGKAALAEGEVGGLLGPCFDSIGATHRYKITIEAVDKDGKVLGVANGVKVFSN